MRAAPPVFLTAGVLVLDVFVAAFWVKERWLPGVVGRLDSIVSAPKALWGMSMARKGRPERI
jgi:hypothetical protein